MAPFVRVPANDERGVSVADLQARGITLTTGEALAVAQSLFEAAADDARPPFGPLSGGNIILHRDGTVTSKACAATPTVLEAAIVIDELLPDGRTQAPGALRYALGRALHEVAAPPFDSLADFLRALRRFETGGRATIVRGLYARAQDPAPVDDSAWQAIGLPFAAALLAGVALIGAGEAMHLSRPIGASALITIASRSDAALDARPIVFNPPPLIVRAPASSTLVTPPTAPTAARHRVAARRDTRPPRHAGVPSRLFPRIKIRFDDL